MNDIINKDVYVRTKIVSHHHKLNTDSFEYFASEKTLIEVSDVEETSFMLSCYKTPHDTDPAVFYSKAHDIISHFIIAINVATLGHFTWDFKFICPAPYILVNDLQKTSHFLYPEGKKYTNDEISLKIEKNLIWRTLQLFLAMGKEVDRSLKKEYIKGLYNLHHSFFDIEFINEAFSNFYKAFEYFSTNKILKLSKLTNEKKQLRQVLSDFGFEEEALKDFDKLYIIRSNQAMHAQKDLELVDKEAVVRIKIFLDSIMHKYYQHIWEATFNERTGT